MSILNLNAPQGRGPRGKKTTKIWMGVGLLAAVLGFGSTFAASITLNNTNTTEFAQGVQTTVYCGSSSPTLSIIPQSTYTNSAFRLTGFKVQGIPKKCSDRDFVFTFLNSSNEPLQISRETVENLTVYWQDDSTPKYPIAAGGNNSGCDQKKTLSGGSSWSSVTASGNTTLFGALLSTSRNEYSSACTYATISKVYADTSGNTSAGNGSFVITFLGGTYELSSDLSKIAVETQEDVFGLVSCSTVDSSKVNCPSTLGLLNSSS